MYGGGNLRREGKQDSPPLHPLGIEYSQEKRGGGGEFPFPQFFTASKSYFSTND